MEITRRHLVIRPGAAVTRAPRGTVRRVRVGLPGHPEVEALVGIPEVSRGVTWHFVGFNTAMDSWEAAKCAIWAERSQTTVVMCELPGLTKDGHRLPGPVRRDLLTRDPVSWALLTWSYLQAAAAAAEVPAPEVAEVLGFSTGCSLAVAALSEIAAARPVSRLTLVEPVAVVRRGLAQLAVDNTADLLRVVRTIPFNRPVSWVRQKGLRQLNEAQVQVGLPDFLAMSLLLASDSTAGALAAAELPETFVVRGARSNMCPADWFEGLDADLSARGVPGAAVTVPGLGHQMWHCLPVVDALAAGVHSTERTAV